MHTKLKFWAVYNFTQDKRKSIAKKHNQYPKRNIGIVNKLQVQKNQSNRNQTPPLLGGKSAIQMLLLIITNYKTLCYCGS